MSVRRGQLQLLRVAVVAVCLLMIAAATEPAAPEGSALPSARGSVVRTGPLAALATGSGRVVPFPHAAGINALVDAIVADGSGGWFIGGGFDSLGGFRCLSIAHVLATRQVDRKWCPRLTPEGGTVDVGVSAIARRGQELFIGGSFSFVDGERRAGIAAVALASGRVLPWRAPHLCSYPGSTCRYTGADGQANVIVIRRNAVYFTGGFARVNQQARFRYAAADLASGKLLPWNPDARIPSPRTSWRHTLSAAAHALFTTADFTRIGGASRNGFAALDYVSAQAKPLRLSMTPCSNTNLVVAYGRIYVSTCGADPNASPCAVAAFDSTNGQPIQWRPSLPEDTHPYLCDEPIAAIAHSIYIHRSFGDLEGWRPLIRVDATTGQTVGNEHLFNGAVFASAPAGGAILVGGDFTAVRPR